MLFVRFPLFGVDVFVELWTGNYLARPGATKRLQIDFQVKNKKNKLKCKLQAVGD